MATPCLNFELRFIAFLAFLHPRTFLYLNITRIRSMSLLPELLARGGWPYVSISLDRPTTFSHNVSFFLEGSPIFSFSFFLYFLQPEEAQSCCSSAITDSIKRTLTTSFGSICLGSLLAAIVQALRMLVHTARQQDDGILLCLAECLLACLEVRRLGSMAYLLLAFDKTDILTEPCFVLLFFIFFLFIEYY